MSEKMDYQRKDELAAKLGKEVPKELEHDNTAPLAYALRWCLKEMGAIQNDKVRK